MTSALPVPAPDELARYDNIFAYLKDQPNTLTGTCAKERWSAFGLSPEALLRVWALADATHRGALDRQEHRIAMASRATCRVIVIGASRHFLAKCRPTQAPPQPLLGSISLARST